MPGAPVRAGAGIVRVLMIGDLIGKPGRQAAEQLIPALREERGIDLVTANGENLAGGMGLTASTARIVLESGVDVITSGNHIWDKREIYDELDREPRILRPLNYGQTGVPGRGWGIFHAADGSEVAVINLQGRTYMQPIENPFTVADALLDEGADELPPIRLVDFHCELTSEKTALGVHLSGIYGNSGGQVGKAELSIAQSKCHLTFDEAFVRGIYCNALVCMAVWLCMSCRSTGEKIGAILFPVTAFVAAGFEHSVANMYFIPVALLIRTDDSWMDGTEGVPDVSGLTWGSFLTDNLVPVTIGNVIGGAIMVGAVYWFVYLRRRDPSD